jgi:3-hydroxyacyl-CoA dehydrogenase
VMQSKCQHPERVLVGHPFNPPHIIPLVEVVGGARTSPEAINQAMAFYSSMGKKAIQLRKEMPGHVANRLQAALYREMLYLIEQGVLSVEETDAAVCYGPGLRWGVMGQSLQWHVGGGAGGINHFMDHLMDPLTGMMKSLGNPQITPQLKQTIIDGVTREAESRSVDELAQEENKLIVGYLALRAKASHGQTEPQAQKKRGHHKSLIAAASLGAVIIMLYLFRSVIFPSYAGLVVALCCVAIGLFLVRGVIHMLLDFDKVEEAEINKKESKDLPLEANAVVQETGISPQTSDIKQN